MPSAYIMKHPKQNTIETWWSPCPSRECPEEDKINLIINQCVDHCLLLEPQYEADSTTTPYGISTAVPFTEKNLPNLNNEPVYYEGNFSQTRKLLQGIVYKLRDLCINLVSAQTKRKINFSLLGYSESYGKSCTLI